MWEVSFLVSAGTCINTSYENELLQMYADQFSLEVLSQLPMTDIF